MWAIGALAILALLIAAWIRGGPRPVHTIEIPVTAPVHS